METIKLFVDQNPWLIAVLVAWTLLWKGIALWKAARNESKVWFVILLVVNTLGVLEIIYIFFVSPRWKGQANKTKIL